VTLSLRRLRQLDDRYHFLREAAPDLDERCRFTFSAKDNICAAGMEATAGSRILSGYRPPFDATAVRRLREAGGALVGKTNMDEFGFGTFCTNSGFGVPLNPYDTERSCGGSSGGAGAAACLIPDHVAVGVSTGGSIACPASFCGVFGFTPTYGRVSRYGLIDYGNSLDKIGVLSRSCAQTEEAFLAIAGKDERDPTSQAQPPLPAGGRPVRSVAVPVEALQGLSAEVAGAFDGGLARLMGMGADVTEVSMPSLKYAMPAYYVLATTEASTNLARYCGMRWGAREEDVNQGFNDFFSAPRSKEFGAEAKRRVLLGTYCRMVGFRDKYYMKALAVRKMIIAQYEEVFARHDVIATPTMPFVAPRFDDVRAMTPLQNYSADFLTIPPNLAGLPHLSMPCAYAPLPVGLQMTAPHWDEMTLLAFGKEWENGFDFRWPEVEA
jgi:aspartyl-tRNA(Asn)/glutamyl-tRNA(Gln) amidotransferase subunit A